MTQLELLKYAVWGAIDLFCSADSTDPNREQYRTDMKLLEQLLALEQDRIKQQGEQG